MLLLSIISKILKNSCQTAMLDWKTKWRSLNNFPMSGRNTFHISRQQYRLISHCYVPFDFKDNANVSLKKKIQLDYYKETVFIDWSLLYEKNCQFLFFIFERAQYCNTTPTFQSIFIFNSSSLQHYESYLYFCRSFATLCNTFQHLTSVWPGWRYPR